MTTITGASNRYSAEVDSSNRLSVRGINTESSVDAVERGDGYTFVTPPVVLTSDAESAVALIKNDEDRDMVIFSDDVSVGPSTGGTVDSAEVYLYNGTGLAMTGGTGQPVTAINLIVGQPASIDYTSELGQEGAAITGASPTLRYLPTGRTTTYGVFGIIPKGAQVAVAVKPPTGNTSLSVNLSVSVYFDITT